jgi:hypothetical protein
MPVFVINDASDFVTALELVHEDAAVAWDRDVGELPEQATGGEIKVVAYTGDAEDGRTIGMVYLVPKVGQCPVYRAWIPTGETSPRWSAVTHVAIVARIPNMQRDRSAAIANNAEPPQGQRIVSMGRTRHVERAGERAATYSAIKRAGGDRATAARALGIRTRTLTRRLERYAMYPLPATPSQPQA